MARLTAGERREQLIGVAVDLFSRKGFNGTTTREIAVAAGVTEAIIFRHFATKEQLYTAIIDRKVNSLDASEWIGELRSAMDCNDDENVIRQLVMAIIFTHKTDPKFERLILYAALEGNEIAILYMRKVTASIVDYFKSYFKRRQKQGALRPMSSDTALLAVAGMAQQFALCKYVHAFKEPYVSDEQAVETFVQIAMNGMCLAGEEVKVKTARKR